MNLLPSDMYTEAIALLGEGFARRQPKHIEEALGVFEALHSLYLSKYVIRFTVNVPDLVAEVNTTAHCLCRRRGVSGIDMDAVINEVDEREPNSPDNSLRIPDVRLELAVAAMLLGLVDFAREALDLSDGSDTPQRQTRWSSLCILIRFCQRSEIYLVIGSAARRQTLSL